MGKIESANDIRKTEIKSVHGQKWRFLFRENGYVIAQVPVMVKKDLVWKTQIHAVDLGSALQYIWSTFNGKIDRLKYEDLEDV